MERGEYHLSVEELTALLEGFHKAYYGLKQPHEYVGGVVVDGWPILTIRHELRKLSISLRAGILDEKTLSVIDAHTSRTMLLNAFPPEMPKPSIQRAFGFGVKRPRESITPHHSDEPEPQPKKKLSARERDRKIFGASKPSASAGNSDRDPQVVKPLPFGSPSLATPLNLHFGAPIFLPPTLTALPQTTTDDTFIGFGFKGKRKIVGGDCSCNEKTVLDFQNALSRATAALDEAIQIVPRGSIERITLRSLIDNLTSLKNTTLYRQ